ncbi:RRQRL motif-containing zinc-binding protein [Nocardia grenadensis]
MSGAEHQGNEVQVYPWRCAPAHLRTRRQLAAQGLRPNGQDIVARVERPRRRGEPLTAYLYDVRLAAAKREATEAQLAVLAKATRERQLRAAERRGISRAEMVTAGDPGPGWADSTTRHRIPGHAFSGLVEGRDREGLER